MHSPDPKKTLVVTPTYNEKVNLPQLSQAVLQALPAAHLLVVDDNSPDGTGALADELSRADARVFVLHRPGKMGLGTAYLQAFGWALERGYERVIQIDADLSHDPKYLPAICQALNEDADVVIGSRNIPGGGVVGWGWARHAISKGGSLYSRLILGMPVRDLTSGYKGFRADVLRALELERIRSGGYSFQVELTYRALCKGFRVKEIPIRFVDRTAGKSKMSKQIFLEAVGMMWKLRLDALRHRL